MTSKKIVSRVSLQLELRGEPIFDDEMREILLNIRHSGSIITASKKLRLSYKHVWDRIREAERLFGHRLVIRKRGGRTGGGTILNDIGSSLLDRYEGDYAGIESYLRGRMIWGEPDLRLAGSHCVGVEILLEQMAKRRPEFKYMIYHIGSFAGLQAVRSGAADLAGVHLFDAGKRAYNTARMIRAPLVKGYVRTQGMIVSDGNPKQIHGPTDILTKDLRMVNRNKGSGTRILADRYLMNAAKKEGINWNRIHRIIRGYQLEAPSHTAVALAILGGRADVGFGIETVARQYGLGFIPLNDENFDFVISRDKFEKDFVKEFISTLSSDDFKRQLDAKAPGLKSTSETGHLIYS